MLITAFNRTESNSEYNYSNNFNVTNNNDKHQFKFTSKKVKLVQQQIN